MPHFARSDQEVCAASISWETFVSLGEFVVCVLLRFEEDFVSQHGHAPKGADRAPLASTYVQYREWKRNIRDHAAIQIQAFYRGSALRGKLHDVQRKLGGEESNSENKLSAVNHRRVEPCRLFPESLIEPAWAQGTGPVDDRTTSLRIGRCGRRCRPERARCRIAHS